MTDIHSKQVRSFNMSQIKSKDTKPEMAVRKFLHRKGFRYRLHVKDLPGKPDIVLPKYRTVILVNGCFWHGHKSCALFRLPKSNIEWWTTKINNNIAKDNKNLLLLEGLGWRVIVVWECQLSNKKIPETMSKITDCLIS